MQDESARTPGPVEANKNKKVLVAMSGGVDSSVAAALLKEQGYDVIGITLQVWDYSECNITAGTGSCCSSSDVEDARRVAEKISIPFYVLNCEDRFEAFVIDTFIDQYLEGRTPSPCVECNTHIKFGHLFQKMKELGCDYLATGHYAMIDQGNLVTSEDGWKDQTYFLFTLKPEHMAHLMFPVGHWTKDQVRAYAESRGLVTARKKDSVGICFVGGGEYKDFIENRVAKDLLPAGPIRLYPEGEILGEHNGIHQFTWGQRKGLPAFTEALYVIKLDPKAATVWVGPEKYLYGSEFRIKNSNWLLPVASGERVKVKIRFHHAGAWATIYPEEGRVVLDEPQRAITPGQAAVFYRDRRLLGGGWIET